MFSIQRSPWAMLIVLLVFSLCLSPLLAADRIVPSISAIESTEPIASSLQLLKDAQSRSFVPPSAEFSELLEGVQPPGAKVWLVKGADSFTVHVRVNEPAMDKLIAKATGPDQKVWRDDSITVFVDSARNYERIHFISVNVSGVVADG